MAAAVALQVLWLLRGSPLRLLLVAAAGAQTVTPPPLTAQQALVLVVPPTARARVKAVVEVR